MLQWKLFDVIVSGSAHTGLQLFFLFKCVGVKEERYRRLAFWLVLIYSLIFYFTEDTIGYLPEFQSSLPLQTAHSLVHAVNTFILLAVVGIFGIGYLPRNFLKCEVYYDVLTVIPFLPMYLASKILKRIFLPPGLSEYAAYPAFYVINSLCIVIGLLQSIAVYYIFGRKIDRFLQKVPDKICLIFFVLTFIIYVSRQTVMLKTNTYCFIHNTSLEFTDSCTFLCNIGLIHTIVLVIIMLFFTILHHQRLQQLQSIESNMLFDYYTNISTLYSSIRSLRHDLSNHLSVLSFMQNPASVDPHIAIDPEGCPDSQEAYRSQTFVSSADSYRTSLLNICDEINHKMQQQISWQQIQTSLLSAREKYEIYHYMTTIMKKHRLPEHALCISAAACGNNTEIQLAIDVGTGSDVEQTSRPKPLHLLMLRHGIDFYMVKTIAQIHNGHADWKRDGSTFILSLTLPEEN